MNLIRKKSLIRNLIVILSLISLIGVSSSLEVTKVELSPSTLLPGDVADGKITITSSTTEEIQSISFTARGVDVSPSVITEIGKIYPNSVYELPFTVSAKNPGVYQVQVKITSKNESIKQIFNVFVEKYQPEIVLKKTKLVLNEVNEVGFTVASSIDISRIRVTPLFDSDPSSFYFQSLDSAEGTFKIYPKEMDELKFKLSYYNGRNYHEVIQTVPVDFTPSRLVFVSANLSDPVVAVKDVVKLFVKITNLRNDKIFKIGVNLDGEGIAFSDRTREIPILESSDSRELEFKVSPEEPGVHEIKITVNFVDEMNNEYSVEKAIRFTANDVEVIGVSNLEIEKTLNEMKVTGDLSNGGKGKARNILIEIITKNSTKDFYVGELDPGDFYTFDFSIPPSKNGTIRVTWTNEIGKTYQTEKTFESDTDMLSTDVSSNLTTYVVITAVIVFVVVGIAWMKARRKT